MNALAEVSAATEVNVLAEDHGCVLAVVLEDEPSSADSILLPTGFEISQSLPLVPEEAFDIVSFQFPLSTAVVCALTIASLGQLHARLNLVTVAGFKIQDAGMGISVYATLVKDLPGA